MSKHYSKRYKAKVKKEAQQAYNKIVKARIKENADFSGLSVKEYCEGETGQFDIW